MDGSVWQPLRPSCLRPTSSFPQRTFSTSSIPYQLFGVGALAPRGLHPFIGVLCGDHSPHRTTMTQTKCCSFLHFGLWWLHLPVWTIPLDWFTCPRDAVEEKAYSGDFATVAGFIEGKATLTDVKSFAQRQAHPALPASRSLFPVHFCEPPPGVPSSRLHHFRYVAIVIVIDGTGLFWKTGMFLRCTPMTCTGFRLFSPSGEPRQGSLAQPSSSTCCC